MYGDRSGTTPWSQIAPSARTNASAFGGRKRKARVRVAPTGQKNQVVGAKPVVSAKVARHTSPPVQNRPPQTTTPRPKIHKAKTKKFTPAPKPTGRRPAAAPVGASAPAGATPVGTTGTTVDPLGLPSLPTSGALPSSVPTYAPLPSATDLVNAQILPQQQALDLEAQHSQQRALDNSAQLKTFTDALLGELKGIPGQVGNDYNQAISQTAALADRSAQLLGAANPNPQVQTDLRAINAPAEQQAQVTQGLNDAFQGAGGVLFQTQGAIPGQFLAAEKASKQAFLAGLNNVAAAQSTSDLKNILQRAALEQADIASKRTGLEAQRAGLMAETLMKLSDVQDQRSQQSFQNSLSLANTQDQRGQQSFQNQLGLSDRRSAARSAAVTNQYKAQQLAFENRLAASQYGMKAQNQRFNQNATQVRLTQGQQRLSQSKQRIIIQNKRDAINTRLAIARTYGADPVTGQPTLAAVKAAKQAAVNKKKNAGASPSQRAKWSKQAGDYAQQSFNGYWAYPSDPHTPVDVTRLLGTKDNQGKEPADVGLTYYKRSYQESVMNLVNQGVPLGIAQRALNRYWTRPGHSYGWEKTNTGRPAKSFQQRRR